jgi:hypothetical protein
MSPAGRKKGFTALISAIIISAVFLLIAVNMSNSSFYGRFNILDAELKEKSFALAEACADMAIFRLADNPNYDPTNELLVLSNGGECTIGSVAGNPKIISVQANHKNYVTKLEIELDAEFLITRIEEK